MRIAILSLFPDYFKGPFDLSIIKQAQSNGLISIDLVDIRDYAEGKHRQVDDRPYGGGPGMVMMAPPVKRALQSHKQAKSHVVYMSPQGKVLTSQRCRELAELEDLVILAGHYEGIDERVLDTEVDEEISIGDYVLTNGCLAAMVMLDALIRFIPGVLGNENSAGEDSFENGMLDHPHYTRPEIFEGKKVPDVLLSGNHQKIAQWRNEKALDKTKAIRPDLYEKLIHYPGEQR